MGSTPSKPITQHTSDVPPSLRFCRERHMVLASVFYKTRSLMCFPTQHSFERFLSNSRKIRAEDDGMGVPSLVLEDPYLLSRVFKGDGVRYRIYKYVLCSASDPLPHPSCSAVSQAGDRIIYKMPFCEVYKAVHAGMQPGYKLVFYTPDGSLNVDLIKHRMSFDMDSQLGEWDVKWVRKARSLLLPDKFELLVTGSSMSPPGARGPAGPSATRVPGTAVWARYKDTDTAFLPKITRKLASLDVGEIEIESNAASYGLEEIPWYTQVIACMSLVICSLQQDRKEKRRRNN
ncbi:LAQU0S21e00650g1_1 [Lachancea quebecensis]|uniref:LAQU0S21e00650g1_1 n=1 Tax=Lachancea quebecensis TaxID=1654605 RepID=A0A0P1KXY8_9SACH|nr:LAQU0S21e00650g1_1 [Lachancea quebecensis]